MPAGAVRAQVVHESGVEEGGDLGTVHQFPGLPGVEWDRCGVCGERQALGVPGHEFGRRYRTALVGPCGVGCQYGPVDSHPVEGKGAVQLG